MKKTALLVGLALGYAGVTAPLCADWSPDDSAGLTAETRNGDYGRVTSVMVSRHGNILYEQYFNDTDSATLHNTRSVTKTVTAMLVGAAIADGLIAGVTEPVTSYFPELQPLKNPDPRKEKITIEDLLTMSSLLECNDSNRYSRGNEERMYVMEDWVGFTLDLPIKGFEPWVTRPEDSPYGRSFSYCTAGAHTLGQIVARASGTGLDAYAAKRLFAPLGIVDVKWPRTGLNRAGAGGGLELTTRALMKLGSLYVTEGVFDGAQLLPASWITASLKTSVEAGRGREYGYLLWKKQVTAGGRSITLNYMSGNGGNRVVFVPEEDLVIVLTKTDYSQRGMHEAADRLIEEGVLARLFSN